MTVRFQHILTVQIQAAPTIVIPPSG